MAKQHFYSRVPAAGSLYNGADGFDTFAQSEGLEQEFVQKELSAAYENKLGKRDAEAVRTETMPLVYSQGCMRSGEIVQSCISYFPKDYTGERSGYLCHSLILSEEDQQKIFFEKDKALLNPRMFKTGVGNMLKQQADAHYPEKVYTPVKAENPKALLKQYDAGMLKGFLFGLLSVLCAKGKTVYFRLPYEENEISEQALRFVNTIASVVPPQLRKNISFVTYVSEPTQYGHIKLKCISERFPEASLSKGIFVDFNADVVMGMPSQDVIDKAPVNFFYSLLGDTKTRDEFFLFMEQATAALPELNLTMKTLSDLVFLFGGTNGRFDQEKILPEDEDIASFLASYEKYRDALGEDLRRNGYRFLNRYVEKHIAIPRNVFTRLARLYPGEMPALKGLIMDVALQMIHTDVMRDRLFAFLQANYENEDKQTRARIAGDICQVFYGGFLQTQILDFFNQNFTRETEEIQGAIFDKLMLTIRTEDVQGKILAFVQNNYGVLTREQKERFYGEIFEFLPACNDLSAALISQVNCQMAQETEEYRAQIVAKFMELLAADYEKEEHLLMPLMCAEPGFCRELVQILAFGPWSDRPLYGEYIALLSGVETIEKTRQLVAILSDVPGKKTEALLGEAVDVLYATDVERTDIYRWFEAETILNTELKPICEALAVQIRKNVVEPAVVSRTGDIFDVTLRVDGPKVLKRYAAENPYLAESEQYAAVFDIVGMTDAIREGKAAAVLKELSALLQRGGDHSRLSAYIDDRLLDWEEQSLARAVLCQMCSNVLRTGAFISDELYPMAKEKCAPIMPKDILGWMKARAQDKSAKEAGEVILKVLVLACRTDKNLAKIVYRDRKGLRTYLWAMRKSYGKDMRPWLEEMLERAPTQLSAIIKEEVSAYKPEPLFAKIGKLNGVLADKLPFAPAKRSGKASERGERFSRSSAYSAKPAILDKIKEKLKKK